MQPPPNLCLIFHWFLRTMGGVEKKPQAGKELDSKALDGRRKSARISPPKSDMGLPNDAGENDIRFARNCEF
jgi:hypothetical protein